MLHTPGLNSHQMFMYQNLWLEGEEGIKKEKDKYLQWFSNFSNFSEENGQKKKVKTQLMAFYRLHQ